MGQPQNFCRSFPWSTRVSVNYLLVIFPLFWQAGLVLLGSFMAHVKLCHPAWQADELCRWQWRCLVAFMTCLSFLDCLKCFRNWWARSLVCIFLHVLSQSFSDFFWCGCYDSLSLLEKKCFVSCFHLCQSTYLQPRSQGLKTFWAYKVFKICWLKSLCNSTFSGHRVF